VHLLRQQAVERIRARDQPRVGEPPQGGFLGADLDGSERGLGHGGFRRITKRLA
jgi:hypothetical protein